MDWIGSMPDEVGEQTYNFPATIADLSVYFTGSDPTGAIEVMFQHDPTNEGDVGHLVHLDQVIVETVCGGSATIRVSGTDSNGDAQTEDLVFTANDTQAHTKYFKTLTSSQVVTFLGVGSFTYKVIQDQWGVVSLTGTSQFLFGCKLVIGNGAPTTYFTDISKQVSFNDGIKTAHNQHLLLVTANSVATFGTLISASNHSTKWGCSFIDLSTNYYGYLVGPSASTTIYLYSCQFQNPDGYESWIEASRIWLSLIHI